MKLDSTLVEDLGRLAIAYDESIGIGTTRECGKTNHLHTILLN